MNQDLTTINTDTLKAAKSDVHELETRLRKIFLDFDGINIRSITKLIHEFNTQIVVNDTLFWEGNRLYADNEAFSWNGDPSKIESIRLLEYKHLSYIIIVPRTPDHPNYIDMFDIGYEDDDDQWGEYVTLTDLCAELNKRNNTNEQKAPTESGTPEDVIFGLIKNANHKIRVNHDECPAYTDAAVKFLKTYLPDAVYNSSATEYSSSLGWFELWFQYNGNDWRLDINLDTNTDETSYELLFYSSSAQSTTIGNAVNPTTLPSIIAKFLAKTKESTPEPEPRTIEARVEKLESLFAKLNGAIVKLNKEIETIKAMH